MGYDIEDGISVDKECVGFPARLSDGWTRFLGGHLRSLALLARLGSGELQLQSERHFPSGPVILDEQIQVAVGKSKKGSGSGSSKRRDQQDRCQLHPLPFVREGVGVCHLMVTQQLHEIYRIQERLVGFAAVQPVFFGQWTVDKLF